MAHERQDREEKIVYVGDSRVRKRTKPIAPKDFSAYPGKSEVFVPNFLLKEWMVGVVVLVGFLLLVLQEKAPLGYPADPLKADFIPMPDWYFLFLYQLLKYPYTSQDWVVFGTFVLPALGFLALLLAPFLDRGPERRFYRRPIASSVMLLSLLAMIHLTVVAWDHYKHELATKGITPEHIQREQELKEQKQSGQPPQAGGGGGTRPVAIVGKDEPGYSIYQKATCVMCHGADLAGKPGAPKLLGIGDKYDKQGILDIIHKGTPSGVMPAQYDALKSKGLSDADIEQLAEWLAKQKSS
ncbi:MAG: menaquinol-cytochrome C reductase [Candidatus Reconcilbacillus cellulovorans]|uniref:Menaquinol-cytochrome C reductase n=1 Tax=Candidatus Reconcilbacillus cellulovorans TaxID=1906605 RepID=A0A2A6E4E5_9BACL|nr:MAG: menaquinol-cytochrome C reductase [Candidatus Reconcilbacillus cellulovorans]